MSSSEGSIGADRRPWIPVIVGPTAVGKTAVVMALSRSWPVAVISADSRQVYRRLDVGTAKPTSADRERVPHYGLDLVEPGEKYSAGRFASDAAGWLSDIGVARKPVVVGGTGFYVRALADGLFHEPPMDFGRRRRLRDWAKGAERLGYWAARLDSGYTGGGRQRAARAIEIALLTGRPLSAWQREARAEGVMRPWYVRLTLPRPVLYSRIAKRARGMLHSGWIEEVEDVLEAGLARDAPGLDAVGYRDVTRYLDGELNRRELEQEIIRRTRRYAKRQETWFRHQLVGQPVITLDATDEPATLAKRIVQLWEEHDQR